MDHALYWHKTHGADKTMMRAIKPSMMWSTSPLCACAQVTNFPFPTPPDRAALAAAQACLQALGALDSTGALTDLGRAMAVLPLSPRPSRMILQVH
jgi:HrpA-like RNA helicase